MLNCLIVGAGGFIGTIFRYMLSLIPVTEDTVFPYVTLLINVLGAFLIGLIMGISGKLDLLSPSMLLFLKVGICGGFTTFSTFAMTDSSPTTVNRSPNCKVKSGVGNNTIPAR